MMNGDTFWTATRHNTPAAAISNKNIGPCPLGPKEINGLLVHPSKAPTLLTDNQITGKPLRS